MTEAMHAGKQEACSDDSKDGDSLRARLLKMKGNRTRI